MKLAILYDYQFLNEKDEHTVHTMLDQLPVTTYTSTKKTPSIHTGAISLYAPVTVLMSEALVEATLHDELNPDVFSILQFVFEKIKHSSPMIQKKDQIIEIDTMMIIEIAQFQILVDKAIASSSFVSSIKEALELIVNRGYHNRTKKIIFYDKEKGFTCISLKEFKERD